ALSVTLKRTVSPSLSRTTLPASTRPPMRKLRSRGASLLATCVGVMKNTRFDWKALRTSVAASPRPASPAAIHNARLVLGFKIPFLLDAPQRAPAARVQQDDLERDGDRGRAVGHPQEILVVHGQAAGSERT